MDTLIRFDATVTEGTLGAACTPVGTVLAAVMPRLIVTIPPLNRRSTPEVGLYGGRNRQMSGWQLAVGGAGRVGEVFACDTATDSTVKHNSIFSTSLGPPCSPPV